MKNILALLLLFMVIPFYGQDIDINENTNEISLVRECSNDKNIKFKNVKEWVAKTFGDYNKVLQYEDKEDCRVIIKARISLQEERVSIAGLIEELHSPFMNFTLTVDCKDDRHRFVVDGIYIDVTEYIIVLMEKSIENNHYDNIKEFVNREVGGEVEITDPLEYESIIDKYEHELDSLKNIDITKFSKKKRNALNNQIIKTNQYITNNKRGLDNLMKNGTKKDRRLSDIKNKTTAMLESLNIAICKDDNF